MTKNHKELNINIMSKLNNQVGSVNILLIPLVLSSLLFLVTLIFGVWAFSGRQDYKNNVDAKIETAVKIAVDKNSSEKDNQFLEKEKMPTRIYKGSDILGSITFEYPKTWSGYYKETDKDLSLVMQPGLVNGAENINYNLKVEVLNSPYPTNIGEYEEDVKTGKLKASAFRLAKLPSVLGTRFDGEFSSREGMKGAVVMLPQREKTVKISAESQEAVADLDNIILSHFIFTP